MSHLKKTRGFSSCSSPTTASSSSLARPSASCCCRACRGLHWTCLLPGSVLPHLACSAGCLLGKSRQPLTSVELCKVHVSRLGGHWASYQPLGYPEMASGWQHHAHYLWAYALHRQDLSRSSSWLPSPAFSSSLRKMSPSLKFAKIDSTCATDRIWTWLSARYTAGQPSSTEYAGHLCQPCPDTCRHRHIPAAFCGGMDCRFRG